MPSQKVNTVLESIRDVHQQLAARYHELDEAETVERIKLLLEDMEDRERRFDECVGWMQPTSTPRSCRRGCSSFRKKPRRAF